MHAGGDAGARPHARQARCPRERQRGRGQAVRDPRDLHGRLPPDGIKRLEDKGVTDVIVGFRVPYVMGPDTEPLDRKVEHLERFAESVTSQRSARDLRPHCPFREAVAGGGAADRGRGLRAHGAGPRRGLRVPCWEHPLSCARVRHDPEHPLFINSTHQYSKQGLDNPDALYFHAFISGDHEYVVTGRRGTTADLSFQVMNGSYSPAEAPDSVAAFDDRALDVADDGTFEIRFGRRAGPSGRLLRARPGLLDPDRPRGLQRLEHRGPRRACGSTASTPSGPSPPASLERVEKRYAVAAKMLVGRIKTWFAFPSGSPTRSPSTR